MDASRFLLWGGIALILISFLLPLSMLVFGWGVLGLVTLCFVLGFLMLIAGAITRAFGK